MCFLCWPFQLNLCFDLQFECGIIDIFNALIAAMGFGFAIYQFIKQNVYNRLSTAEQNNKNWYLSVLVIPQLERINNYFDETVCQLKELKNEMDDNNLILRAQEQRKQNDKISAFLAPLEAEISSYDNALREKISELELSLQDEITKIISDTSVEPTGIERRVMEYKGKLIGLLYQPIQRGEQLNT